MATLQELQELETEVKLLKKDVKDQKIIYDKLDLALEKLTEVSNSIYRMLAVHEEKDEGFHNVIEAKIARQEEAIDAAEKQIEIRRTELRQKIDEIHSRMTTLGREQSFEIQNLRKDINNRVAILERWRWLIIGGSIVLGFILHKIFPILLTK